MNQEKPHSEGNQESFAFKAENLNVELHSDDQKYSIVKDISFTISTHRVLALVGESGSGKTITSLSIMQLLPKSISISSGKALLRLKNGDVIDIARLKPNAKEMTGLRGESIGMIFQEPMSSFSPLLTIGSHITDVISAHRKVSKTEARKRAIDLLELVGIPNANSAFNRYPDEFSGGMRQRAMIARALVCEPSLLIADEPTTALDVTIQAQILSLIRDIQKEMGMAVLFITHDLGVVAQVADDVAVMYGGHIVEIGPVETVFHRPLHPYTNGLMNAVPQLGEVTNEPLPSIPGNVPIIYEMPEGCTFHPRCTYAKPGICDSTMPNLEMKGRHHKVRCYMVEEGDQKDTTEEEKIEKGAANEHTSDN